MGTYNRNFKDVVIRNIALDNPKISIFLNCSHWAVHWSQLTGSGCVFGCESAFGVVSSSIGKLIGDIVLSTSTDKMKTDCKKVKKAMDISLVAKMKKYE